jgi:hypothetical protein
MNIRRKYACMSNNKNVRYVLTENLKFSIRVNQGRVSRPLSETMKILRDGC